MDILERRPRAVRFVDFTLEKLEGGRCRARVELDRQLNPALRQRYIGTAEDAASAAGTIKCSALAALEALRRVVGAAEEDLTLEDLKAVKVFDESAVIVALRARHKTQARRLVGFCLVEENAAQAAALAVLNATNRFLGTG